MIQKSKLEELWAEYLRASELTLELEQAYNDVYKAYEEAILSAANVWNAYERELENERQKIQDSEVLPHF